uniref:Putative peritrophin-like protein 1 ctenocephalides felis n=1 Tax=Xenopsylla cheopis TaxID=163159 RepID=A0A6M2DZP7_XENCH
MKLFSGLIIATIALGAAVADGYAPMYVRGVPVAKPQARAAATDNEFTCPSGKFGAMCADCSTMLFCTGSTTPVTTITCKDNPSVPYCVNNQCSAQKNESDPTCDKGGNCAVNGYQPDPKDCTRYIYCHKGVSTVFECPSGYVYDHATNLCKKKTSEADCATLTCTKANTFITYTPDRSIYAYCDDKLEPIVLQCEDDQNQWFDVSSKSCRIVCKKEGAFADRKDCTKYYQCFIVNNQWQLKSYQCPSGLYFDAEEKMRCVPGTCTPEITDAPPETTEGTTESTGTSESGAQPPEGGDSGGQNPIPEGGDSGGQNPIPEGGDSGGNSGGTQ